MTFLKSITFWPQQWHFLGTYFVLLALIYTMSDSLMFFAYASMGFVALFVADLLVKTQQVFLSVRRLIDGIDKYAVIVTGCDSGFGLDFAQRLASIGFLVYATVLFPEGEGPQKLKQNKNVVVLKMDITRQEEIDSVVETITADLNKRKKTLWSLVNNAGVAIYCDIEIAPMDHYKSIMDINAFGPLRMCKAILPLLRANRRGRIVSITSMSGRFPLTFATAYNMSKRALIAFCDGLRVEVKPWDITVHTIQPSFYQTHDDFDNQLKIGIDKYYALWDKAPENVKKASGVQYRDERIKALREICSIYAQPISKMNEVTDDMIDAVAGVSPQLCYTPNTVTKMTSRLLDLLPTEMVDKIITPKVNQVPAELQVKTAQSVESYSIPAYQLFTSSVWHCVKLFLGFVVPSSGAVLGKTAN